MIPLCASIFTPGLEGNEIAVQVTRFMWTTCFAISKEELHIVAPKSTIASRVLLSCKPSLPLRQGKENPRSATD